MMEQLLKSLGIEPKMITDLQQAAVQAVETLKRIEQKIDALEKHLSELETTADGN